MGEEEEDADAEEEEEEEEGRQVNNRLFNFLPRSIKTPTFHLILLTCNHVTKLTVICPYVGTSFCLTGSDHNNKCIQGEQVYFLYSYCYCVNIVRKAWIINIKEATVIFKHIVIYEPIFSYHNEYMTVA